MLITKPLVTKYLGSSKATLVIDGMVFYAAFNIILAISW